MTDTPPSGDALDELRTLLDGELLVTGSDDLERYRVPARGAGGELTAVARPRTTDQVRAVVAWARRHLVHLVPQGANSGLVGSSVPGTRAAIVVSTDLLRAPLQVDPDDRTAIAGAGVRLSELNDAAAPHGLHLAIDLGADPSLGGMVATNTGGARMLRYGDMRHHLLGVQAVIADEDCSVVGRVDGLRKRNEGPALEQLLVGSSGALGIVTAVKVELDVREPDRACAWWSPVDDAAAVTALGEFERAAVRDLSAYEVLSAAAVAAGVEHAGVPLPIPTATGRLVLVELSGPPGAEDRLVGVLERCRGRGLLADAVVVPPEHAWRLRHAVSDGLKAHGTVTGFDLSVPRPLLPELCAVVTELVPRRAPRARVADFGHWGDGGVHCNVVWPMDAPPSSDELIDLRQAVVEVTVERFGGSYSAEHGIGPVNAEEWRRRTPPAEQRILGALKASVDPLGVLGHPGLPF